MALLQKRIISRCNQLGKPVHITRIVDTMASGCWLLLGIVRGVAVATQLLLAWHSGVPRWWSVVQSEPDGCATAFLSSRPLHSCVCRCRLPAPRVPVTLFCEALLSFVHGVDVASVLLYLLPCF